MKIKNYDALLEENRKPISVLTTRVNSIVDSIDQLRLTMVHMIDTVSKMDTKIDKISDKVFEKPEYLSVGEIALKQGVSGRTVRRRIKEKVIPFERNEGEKAYRIPVEEYHNSISHDGTSLWFQNHTRE
tara:strand:- start:173 stop:559 length:387 start_codon:yes stop_codon:yes gene_type:complete